MEFYYGTPSSKQWADASRFENYVASMEKSFHSKRYFLPTMASGLFLISILILAAL